MLMLPKPFMFCYEFENVCGCVSKHQLFFDFYCEVLMTSTYFSAACDSDAAGGYQDGVGPRRSTDITGKQEQD